MPLDQHLMNILKWIFSVNHSTITNTAKSFIVFAGFIGKNTEDLL